VATLQAEINKALYGRQSTAHPRSDKSKRTADGIVFDSIPEMKRYQELRDLQRTGVITKLQIHPTFDIRWPTNDAHLCYLTPDFSYITKETNELVVEDVKGTKRTKKGNLRPRVEREFGLKRKLLLAAFGIDLKIITLD
jgi:hypothetical protein